MNYQKHYDLLIEKYGTWEKPKGVYTERHRKLPGYLGGKYVKGNAFYMEARAHYVAHLLWAKITSDFEAWCAVKQMGARNGRQASKMYALARELHAKEMSIRFSGENHPMFGKSASEETRIKQSRASKGKPKSDQMKARLSATNMGHPVSDRTIEILRTANLGRKASDEARLKMSVSLLGNTRRLGVLHTEETKKIISEKGLGRVWPDESKLKSSISAKTNIKACEFCGMIANPGNLTRHMKKHLTKE